MKVVVGLGNPGRSYERTPHNVGFEVIERLAGRAGCRLRESRRFRARLAPATLEGVEMLLVEPLTFMNASGEAVAAVLAAHRRTAEDLLVIVDDADLELGRLRIRPRGGSAGHRGLASVIAAVGTEDFSRLRLGVGRRGDRDLVRHVLSPFSDAEWSRLQPVLESAADAVLCVIQEGVNTAMNRFNAPPPAEGPGKGSGTELETRKGT